MTTKNTDYTKELDELSMPGERKKARKEYEEDLARNQRMKSWDMGLEGLAKIGAGLAGHHSLKDKESYGEDIKLGDLPKLADKDEDLAHRFRQRRQDIAQQEQSRRQAMKDKIAAEQREFDRTQAIKSGERADTELKLKQHEQKLREADRKATQASKAKIGEIKAKKDKLTADMKDPSSELSAQQRQMLSDLTGKSYPDSLTADAVNKIMSQELAKAAKTEEGRLSIADKIKQRAEKLTGEGQKRFSLALYGLRGIENMIKAVEAGSNTFSVFGDNEYTMNRDSFTEAMGRLNSGGAINKEEEIRFKNAAPTWKDPKKMKLSKLKNIQSMMATNMYLAVGMLPPSDMQPELLRTLMNEKEPKKPGKDITTPPASPQDDPFGINKMSLEEINAELGVE